MVTYNHWRHLNADFVCYNPVKYRSAWLSDHIMDSKDLSHHFRLIFLRMFHINYGNIAVLVVDFVYKLLDKLDNPNYYNDNLDVVVVVVYEKREMTNNKDYRWLPNEHLINLNLEMKLSNRLELMNVPMVELKYVWLVVDGETEVDAVGIVDHA